MIDHVNALALAVRDVRKSAEFYRDRLGFILKEVSDEFAYLKFNEDKGPGLALVSRAGLEKEIPGSSIPDKSSLRFYFASFLESADKEFKELHGKGVHFVTSPANRPDGQRFAFFEDPEGNLWEISNFPK
jgi:catechol 2,3-dioxygenase-like lactoylglutathione lyase family enzyme